MTAVRFAPRLTGVCVTGVDITPTDLQVRNRSGVAVSDAPMGGPTRLSSSPYLPPPRSPPTHSPLVNDRLGWTLRDELTLVLSHDTDSTCRGRQVLERVYPYLFGPWRDAMNKRLPLEDAAASSRPAAGD